MANRLTDLARRALRSATTARLDPRERARLEVLSEVEVFAPLPRRVLKEVALAVHERRYRADEPIFREGDPGLGLYLVQDGSVRLVSETDGTAPVEIGQAGPGDVFGEISIFGTYPRLCSAYALVDTTLLGLFRPDLRSVINRNPTAGAELVIALSRYQAGRYVDLIRTLTESQSPDDDEPVPSDDTFDRLLSV